MNLISSDGMINNEHRNKTRNLTSWPMSKPNTRSS